MSRIVPGICLFVELASFPISPGQTAVLTYHNDVSRTGQSLAEPVLRRDNVDPVTFGLLFSLPVDGYVYAQPLYVPGVNIPGLGTRNVVYIATEHDSVYAFDADSGGPGPLWSVNFLGTGATPIPPADVNCGQIVPEIGITATPVIDASPGTLYVVASTKETPAGTASYVQRLHALDIATGGERSGSPVTIRATVPGAGDGSSTVTFDPQTQNERAGLLLLNNVIYTSWSSHCDQGAYHGWILGYDAKTLQQVAAYSTTSNGREGAIWAGGAAPAADAQSNIYVSTGNGQFDGDQNGPDYGDSFLKLAVAGGALTLADFFTPFNQAALSSSDKDLGSGGVLLLPDSAGNATHPHLLIGAGKEGKVYLVDRDHMGGFNANADNVLQSLPNVIGPSFGAPAFFNGVVYYGGSGNPLTAFTMAGGALSGRPSSTSATIFRFPGTTPSISANGTSDGIVWAIENLDQAVLHAYSAENLAQELYNSSQANGRDSIGGYVKFTVPTVANGRVYVGCQSTVAVFGLLPGQPLPAGGFVNGASFHGSGAAPGEIISLFSENLTGVTASAISIPFPATLFNTSVAVSDGSGASQAATLIYVSPSQINFVMPDRLAPGMATIAVAGSGGQFSVGSVPVQSVAPGIFAANGNGRGVAAAMITTIAPDGSETTQMTFQCGGNSCSAAPILLGPSNAQTLLSLFGSGIRGRTGLPGVQVQVGGISTKVIYAGPQGQFDGLDQINVVLPRSLAGAGVVDIDITVDGQAANPVSVSFE